MSPARLISFEILKRVESEDAFAANLLASHLTAQLSNEDRSLAHEIVLGVLRWQRRIDYFLEKISARKLSRMDLEVVIALRMGFYQLRYLTRMPARAAVNESVNLVKLSGKRSAAGLTNAVLRKITELLASDNQRLNDKLDEIDEQEIGDEVERDSIRYSHPGWLYARWAGRYGLEWARELAVANNNAAPLSFRLNLLAGSRAEILEKIKQAGLAVSASKFNPEGYKLAGGSSGALLELAARGLVHIQDAASQQVASLVDAQAGMTVLDACAAPGGKTTLLAAQMGNRGLIIAGDLYPARLRLLQDNCRRLGVTIVAPIGFDAAAPLPFWPAQKFDRILIDAPCSGTGTLRRNPEIKWRLTAAKIAEMAALQQRILSNCAPLLASGGRLIYSTCSLEEEEDEAVIKSFLQTYQQFSLGQFDAPSNNLAELITPAGFLRTWPQRDHCDGFFAALLVKGKG